MIVDLILPHKERFTDANAGAVAQLAYQLAVPFTADNKSTYRIFGSPVDTPKTKVAFCPITAKPAFFQSKNKAFARAYLAQLDPHNMPDLVEIHGRPEVADLIARSRPDLNVALYLHNDPRAYRGAKSSHERRQLLQKLSGIFCITYYVKSCFLDGVSATEDDIRKISVNLLGVDRPNLLRHQKENVILMVGRMVPEKGFLEACQAAVPILQDHPDWKLQLVGGKDFISQTLSPYERRIKDALAPIADQVDMRGHTPLDEVRSLQRSAAICMVPSPWQEPGGLTVLEALAAGAALITTKKGGIPEFAQGRAVIVSDPSIRKFQDALSDLIKHPEKRTYWQDQAWQDYPFSAEEMAHRAHKFRQTISKSSTT